MEIIVIILSCDLMEQKRQMPCRASSSARQASAHFGTRRAATRRADAQPHMILIAVLMSVSVSVIAQDSEKPSEAEYGPPVSYEEAVRHMKSTPGLRNLQRIGLALHFRHDKTG